ncbi:uncharacterized protein LOC143633558 [Bidens hawaiensis]|uniref:uncharacterized protein LOC143633558 n=1 Tax=Bidens hawaiensis TaxID=980011 RepID=UPI0040495BB5
MNQVNKEGVSIQAAKKERMRVVDTLVERDQRLFKQVCIWDAINPDTTDSKIDNAAINVLFQSIHEQQNLQVGSLKVVGSNLTRYLEAESVREARLQTLIAKISEISSNYATVGETFKQRIIVKKFLTSLPLRFVHIVATLEQILDLKTVGLEDVVGRLKAYERTKDEEIQSVDQEEGDEEPVGIGVRVEVKVETMAKTGESEITPNNKAMKNERVKIGQSYNVTDVTRWVISPPLILNERRKKNITEGKETLMMLQQVDESVYLNKEKVLPSQYESKGPEEGIWYLDNGASNHMT